MINTKLEVWVRKNLFAKFAKYCQENLSFCPLPGLAPIGFAIRFCLQVLHLCKAQLTKFLLARFQKKCQPIEKYSSGDFKVTDSNNLFLPIV